MRRFVAAAAATAFSLVLSHALAAGPSDVPASHWAAASVGKLTSLGVMDAPNGKFDGGRKVTRIELVNILARYAKALESGGWRGSGASPAKRKQPAQSAWATAPVTRYELAALLDRTGQNVSRGLPQATGKTFGKTEAIPPVSIAKVPKTNPAHDSLDYLAKNHMVWGKSVLLDPTNATVSGSDVVDAVTMVIAGVNDRLTDEPQNREDLGTPPSHKHSK